MRTLVVSGLAKENKLQYLQFNLFPTGKSKKKKKKKENTKYDIEEH